MSKVSVAMAVYNGEKYMKRQIDSILPQLKAADELVISYDTSTDNTLAIVKEYCDRDSRVKLFYNSTPGLFANFQNAIANCTGDFIFISDQDDIWAESKIQTVVEHLKDEKYGMVIHNGVHVDNDENVISNSFFDIYDIGPHRFKNFFKPRYSGCCIAFTASLKNAIIPFPSTVGAYDHWIGEIGSRLGKVIYEPKLLIFHRLHGDNFTPKSHRKMSVVIKARLSLLKQLSKRKRAVLKARKKEKSDE